MENRRPLLEILNEMRNIDPAKDYYAFSYLFVDGKFSSETQTHWVGWADEKYTQEVREASLVKPEAMTHIWERLKEPYWIVNQPRHYFVYLCLGGHALVASDVARECDPELLKPKATIRSGSAGFVSVRSVPAQAFNHAPTPKQRMRILKRDKHQCAICGRKPADYVDLELHVHHIRPWARGGLTEDKNLITLCQTCHKGLDPHEDHDLFKWTSPNEFSIETTSKEYIESVLRYRESMRKLLENEEG